MIQHLTAEQVENIYTDLNNQYLQKEIKSKYDTLIDSIKPLVESRKNDEKWVAKYADLEANKLKDIEVLMLYKKMIELDSLLNDGLLVIVPFTSIDSLESYYNNRKEQIADNILSEIKLELHINDIWRIQEFVKEEVLARLSLMAFDSYDKVIENIKNSINIEKYLLK